MPRNILCIGGTQGCRLALFLQLFPFLQKKNQVEFIWLGSKSKQIKIDELEKLGIKTFYYSGSPKQITDEIQIHQVFNESEYSLCHWFDSKHEYDCIWADRRIYIIDKNSPLVKWYKSIKRYSISSAEDTLNVFLQYWQLHNGQSLWFSEEEGFYPGILGYEIGGATAFCYFVDSEDVRNAIALYCFLKKYLPRREGGGPIKYAENCIKRSSYNILSLDPKDPDVKKNWVRLRRVIV
jgi:hypothetical protein